MRKKVSAIKTDKDECDRLYVSIYQAKRNLERSKRELESIKNDCNLFTTGIITNEDDIREQIINKSIILHSNDSRMTKENIERIYNELMINIGKIEENNREDLLDRKEEMDKRIEVRLMNTDGKFMHVLNEKIGEHEKMSRNLHSMTQDMTKIKENYNNIIKRTNEYKFNVNDLSNKLEDEKKKWSLQILELKKFKILTEKENKKRPFSSITKCTSTKTIQTERNNKNDKMDNYISKLEQISNTEKTKVNKLTSKYNNIFDSRSKMENRIYELMEKIKTDTPFYSIEDRNKFINIISHDKEILSYYNDEKFPTVHVSYLILNK